MALAESFGTSVGQLNLNILQRWSIGTRFRACWSVERPRWASAGHTRLISCRAALSALVLLVSDLWSPMDTGGFCDVLEAVGAPLH